MEILYNMPLRIKYHAGTVTLSSSICFKTSDYIMMRHDLFCQTLNMRDTSIDFPWTFQLMSSFNGRPTCRPTALSLHLVLHRIAPDLPSEALTLEHRFCRSNVTKDEQTKNNSQYLKNKIHQNPTCSRTIYSSIFIYLHLSSSIFIYLLSLYILIYPFPPSPVFDFPL